MISKMYHSPFQPNISQSIIVSKRLAGLSHEELVWRLSVLECAVLMTQEQSKQKSGPSNLSNVRSHFNVIPHPLEVICLTRI